jgi:tRNA dimethylallyltransferase
MLDAQKPDAVAILGPTASGKSDLGLRLALECGGEIVNCDSVQIYRHFDIGAAKTPTHQRLGIPHHLVDVIEPDEPFTAGDYARLAAEAIAGIRARNRLPVIVGGTGFYFRALTHGLFEGPGRNEELRARLAAREQRRPGSLHRLLRRFDPFSSQRIHPNDTPKLIRALEVHLLTGRPLSQWFATGKSTPVTALRILTVVLDPPRDLLYPRINARCDRMFGAGLIDEVRGILALGYSPHAKPFQSLGYSQALAVVEERMTLDEALDETRTRTRQYAKRQRTWFRKEAGAVWIPSFGEQTILQPLLRGFMA